MRKISLVIPSFNEAHAIPVVLSEIESIRNDLSNHPVFNEFEVIVVDDGSEDHSKEIIAEKPWVHLHEHGENMGYGAALKTGIRLATGNVIAFMDMDGTCHVPDLIRFSEQVVSDSWDMIVGHRTSSKQAMPWHRRIGNLFFSKLSSHVMKQPIGDCCSGIRVVRADLLKEYAPRLPDGFDFALALTLAMAKKSKKFIELPVTYKKRVGRSKLSEVSDGMTFLYRIISARQSLDL